jgi:hypothetical protein
MKSMPRFVSLATVLLMMATAAGAAAKPGLSGFLGPYSGVATVQSAGNIGGPVTINITGPKNGKKAIAESIGYVISGDNTLQILNVLGFSPGGQFSTNNLKFNLEPTPATSGTYKVKKNSITFSAPWSFNGKTGMINGKLSLLSGGKRLLLKYTLTTVGEAPFNFTIKANRNVK